MVAPEHQDENDDDPPVPDWLNQYYDWNEPMTGLCKSWADEGLLMK